MHLDGKKLQRPWFTTPLLMTGCIIVTCYLVTYLVIGLTHNNNGYGYRPAPSPGLWPLYVGLFFGLCGVGWGRSFNSAARADVGGNFRVSYLKPDHWLTQRVHALAAKLDLPPPAVGVVNVVNAFAMGSSPKDAAVVLGVPLVNGLSGPELDAVIGHELGHVATGDMTRMQFAEGYQRMFGTVFAVFTAAIVQAIARRSRTAAPAQLAHSLGGVGRVILGFGSEIMVKGLSRSREFHADAIGAALSSPEAMKGALNKLHSIATKPTAAENQYGYMMFKGAGSFGGMFSTHPTLEHRLAALESKSHLNKLPLRGDPQQQPVRQAAPGGDITSVGRLAPPQVRPDVRRNPPPTPRR